MIELYNSALLFFYDMIHGSIGNLILSLMLIFLWILASIVIIVLLISILKTILDLFDLL